MTLSDNSPSSPRAEIKGNVWRTTGKQGPALQAGKSRGGTGRRGETGQTGAAPRRSGEGGGRRDLAVRAGRPVRAARIRTPEGRAGPELPRAQTVQPALRSSSKGSAPSAAPTPHISTEPTGRCCATAKCHSTSVPGSEPERPPGHGTNSRHSSGRCLWWPFLGPRAPVSPQPPEGRSQPGVHFSVRCF